MFAEMPPAISLIKPKPALIPAEKIDRYGVLDQKVRQFAPTRAEYEALRKEFQVSLAEHPAGEPYIAHGAHYEVQFTARRNERTITEPVRLFNRLRKLLGLDLLLQRLRIPLALVDQHIAPEMQSAFLKEERTGARDMAAVATEEAA
jgi:hypothetical protein